MKQNQNRAIKQKEEWKETKKNSERKPIKTVLRKR